MARICATIDVSAEAFRSWSSPLIQKLMPSTAPLWTSSVSRLGISRSYVTTKSCRWGVVAGELWSIVPSGRSVWPLSTALMSRMWSMPSPWGVGGGGGCGRGITHGVWLSGLVPQRAVFWHPSVGLGHRQHGPLPEQ